MLRKRLRAASPIWTGKIAYYTWVKITLILWLSMDYYIEGHLALGFDRLILKKLLLYLFCDSRYLEELGDSMLLEDVGIATQLQVVKPALNTGEQWLGGTQSIKQ